MRKTIAIFILLFSILYASDDTKEELRSKIEYSLNCAARVSHVSEIKISSITKSKKYSNMYLVVGTYRAVLSIAGQKGGFSIGDDFHPQSGSFKAIVDENLNIKRLKWKTGLFSGYVTNRCLMPSEDDL